MTLEEFQATKQVISPLTHSVRSGYTSGDEAIKVLVYASSEERNHGYVIEDNGPDTPARYVVQFEGETVRGCIVDDLEKSLYAYACGVEEWMDSTKVLIESRVELLAEALESGKYFQSTGALRAKREYDDGIGHCCLAVACEVWMEHNPGKAEWVPVDTLPVQLTDSFTSAAEMILRIDGEKPSYHHSVLPDEVQEWFGFAGPNPELTIASGSYPAGELNDCELLDFAEIAKGFRNLLAA